MCSQLANTLWLLVQKSKWVNITKVLKANIKKRRIHVIQGLESVMQLVLNGKKVENKKKYLEFVTTFHLLKHGKPMINFEHNMKELFEFLEFTNALNKC